MYDHFLEEMADAIAKEFHVNNNDVLGILNQYWQDKIAHVWQVDDLLECARNDGQPITRSDAADLLQHIFEHHDSSMGISWTNLHVALEDYHLDFNSLPAEKYKEVHGVFKVWQKGSPIAHQFGMFPKIMDGNLPDAIDCAKRMARQNPEVPIFIACVLPSAEDAEPWLTVILLEGEMEPILEESEESCTQ